jgi:hypothetical protein
MMVDSEEIFVEVHRREEGRWTINTFESGGSVIWKVLVFCSLSKMLMREQVLFISHSPTIELPNNTPQPIPIRPGRKTSSYTTNNLKAAQDASGLSHSKISGALKGQRGVEGGKRGVKTKSFPWRIPKTLTTRRTLYGLYHMGARANCSERGGCE